ncbi:MAG: hypothetical protein PHV17_01755 [Candidatus Omnitrophica bacterium]|nr:hypothetical protein [Candidatus Omnitrophota bacterium]
MKNSIITYPFICSLVIHFCLISGFGLIFPKEPKTQEKKQIKISLRKQDLIPDIKRLSLKKELTAAQASENRKILPVSENSGDFGQKKPDQLKKSANNKEEIFITNPDKDDLLRFEDLIKRKIQKARFYPIWGKNRVWRV